MKIPSLTERADYYDLEGAAKQGLMLPHSSALAFEEALAQNEEDLISRARMLGYYSLHNLFKNRVETAAAHLNHVLWFIKNAPGCKFAGDTYLAVDQQKSPENYRVVRKAWLAAIKLEENSSQISINAALFFFDQDPSQSLKLVKSVLKREPDNVWAKALISRLTGDEKSRSNATAAHSINDAVSQYKAEELKHLDTCSRRGKGMPPISAANLEKVVSKFPRDITARAELLGYYRENFERANVLQVDPEMVERMTNLMVWFIKSITVDEFVRFDMSNIELIAKATPNAYAMIRDAWASAVEDNQHNAAVLANAAHFYLRTNELMRAKRLLKILKESDKSKTLASSIDEEFRSYARFKRMQQKHSRDHSSMLEEISSDPNEIPIEIQSPKYSLTEWASEVDLSGAHLEGVYHWVPATSIANLENVLDKNSEDIFNRAKIIGFYDGCMGENYRRRGIELSRKQKASHLQHMFWFIKNIPECRFVGTFKGGSKAKKDRLFDERLKDRLLLTVRRYKNNTNVLVNVAMIFCYWRKSETRKILKTLELVSPEWASRIEFLLGGQPKDEDVQRGLATFAFQPGRKNFRVTQAVRAIRGMFGMSLSRRAVLSNEGVLKRNPNDILLRQELLYAHHALNKFALSFGGFAPDEIPHLLKHNLWFIQNTPECATSPLSRDLMLYCRHKSSPWFLGPHAILLAAAKSQIDAYPRNLNIALAMCRYFPLNMEQKQLKILRKFQKSHPQSKLLLERIKHLRKLRDIWKQ